MFTGIIERLGTIQKIEKEGSNVHFTIASDISKELKIDQSLAHNGVCLTVVEQTPQYHVVTAIEETLRRTNLGELKVGDAVNLERAMSAHARLDGHIVQGHVDTTAECVGRVDEAGSWLFTFAFDPIPRNGAADERYILVDKGSVCVNGVSLTVVNPTENTFSVAIIPYTFEHTTFGALQVGDHVNLEFDIIGKYLMRYMAAYRKILV